MDIPADNQSVDQPHNTGSLILAVAILGLLIAGGIMYFSQTEPRRPAYPPPAPATVTDIPTDVSKPEPQREWKKYTDKTHTFTVLHPASMYETPETPDPDNGIEASLGVLSTVKPYNNGLDRESDLRMEFAMINLPADMDLDEYIMSRVLTHPREDTDGNGVVEPPVVITPSVRKTIRPDGTKTEWLEGLAFMSVPHAEVFVPYRENKVIHVRIFEGTAAEENRNNEQYRKNITLAEQIVSTFQFVE